ncbi:MAG: ABC transporter permease [Chitinispirillaceae bacterium]|nr:ABC transporter permease [Chitinispirillaceae bacterium]
MRRRIGAIALKEMRHIVRDWQTLMVIILMPVLMMFLYGYALTMDLIEVPVIVEEPSPSRESERIVAAIDATTLFRVAGRVRVVSDPEDLFKRQRVKMLFRFPASFAADLRRGSLGAHVQVLIDGSDPNVGTILKNAVESLVLKATLDVLGIKQPTVVTIDQRILYNQEQRSALYFVPGLMAIILLMISALLTSLAITREKELGTLEQLLVSPLRPFEIIFGKILPYILLAAFDGALILLVGYALFGVRVAGSLLFLAGASGVYIFTALAIGLMVSTVARNQQQAMMIVLPATLLPTIILSGFIFPLASLPFILRVISYGIPATHFLEIVRGIILKGAGPALLATPLLILTGMSCVLIAIAVKKFQVRL